MRILVRGEGAALALGGLAASCGHRVWTDPPRSAVRIRSRAGWLEPALADGEPDPELVLEEMGRSREDGPGARRLRIRSGAGADWLDAAVAPDDCVTPFGVLQDGLDLWIDTPRLVMAQDPGLRRLLGACRSTGLAVRESRDLGGQLGALMQLRLLDLPATLCNTSVAGLLADDEGRRIALAVLEEGARAVERLGLGPGRLDEQDPAEIVSAIQQRSRTLEAARYRPGLPVSALLDAIRRGVDTQAYLPQRALARRAGDLGVGVDWNRRLLGCLPRVIRVGFYDTPLDLLRAVA